tara:strand:+ start:1818 stop:2036 length:219 start_codon:yes stop_codon:yes gene_type:complete
MKSFKNIILLITIFFVLVNKRIYPITNYEISTICNMKKKEAEKDCIERIKTNRYKLNRGEPIEVPIFPYKKK